MSSGCWPSREPPPSPPSTGWSRRSATGGCCWSPTTASTWSRPSPSWSTTCSPAARGCGAGHQPRAAGHRRGAAAPGRAAGRPRRRRLPRRGPGLSGGAAAGRPGRGRAARVQRRPGDPGAGAAHLPGPGRHAAGHRAGRGPVPRPLPGAGRGPAGRPLPAADRRQPATLRRHQTLRAVVDWSWELLGGAEQVLLRRLAVFAGGATLEAVERVCAGPARPPGRRRGAVPARRAGRQVAGGGGRARRRRGPLPDAGDGPGLRGRAAQGGR